MATTTTDRERVTVPGRLLTRLEVENFLYREAALLDSWQLDDWLALFDEDGVYEIPPPDAVAPETASRAEIYFIIGDDYARLSHRVSRLKKPNAHAEGPRSKVCRIYSNVTIDSDDGERIGARLNFVMFRTKRGTVEFFGHMLVDLRRKGDGFAIVRKRVILDIDALVPQGKVSAII